MDRNNNNNDSDTFYCNLFILINTCLFIEMISFFMREVKMAIIFRSMVIAMISIPIINHYLPNSPFGYCYNQLSMNRLLFQLFIEDIILFIVIRRGSFLFYHLSLVFLPLVLFYCLINKESVIPIIQKIQSTSNSSIV